MIGNGNNFKTLFQKLYFMMIPTAQGRSNYVKKHEKEFRHVGDQLHWQPRQYPADPEMISIGNNVRLASGVNFNNHDGMWHLLNRKFHTNEFERFKGCIEIGDNVLIGSYVTIMPNVRIGSNVAIGAGSIVTKDIPDNSVAVGIPCKVIGSFADLVEKRRKYKDASVEETWQKFYNARK